MKATFLNAVYELMVYGKTIKLPFQGSSEVLKQARVTASKDVYINVLLETFGLEISRETTSLSLQQ